METPVEKRRIINMGYNDPEDALSFACISPFKHQKDDSYIKVKNFLKQHDNFELNEFRLNFIMNYNNETVFSSTRSHIESDSNYSNAKIISKKQNIEINNPELQYYSNSSSQTSQGDYDNQLNGSKRSKVLSKIPIRKSKIVNRSSKYKSNIKGVESQCISDNTESINDHESGESFEQNDTLITLNRENNFTSRTDRKKSPLYKNDLDKRFPDDFVGGEEEIAPKATKNGQNTVLVESFILSEQKDHLNVSSKEASETSMILPRVEHDDYSPEISYPDNNEYIQNVYMRRPDSLSSLNSDSGVENYDNDILDIESNELDVSSNRLKSKIDANESNVKKSHEEMGSLNNAAFEKLTGDNEELADSNNEYVENDTHENEEDINAEENVDNNEESQVLTDEKEHDSLTIVGDTNHRVNGSDDMSKKDSASVCELQYESDKAEVGENVSSDEKVISNIDFNNEVNSGTDGNSCGTNGSIANNYEIMIDSNENEAPDHYENNRYEECEEESESSYKFEKKKSESTNNSKVYSARSKLENQTVKYDFEHNVNDGFIPFAKNSKITINTPHNSYKEGTIPVIGRDTSGANSSILREKDENADEVHELVSININTTVNKSEITSSTLSLVDINESNINRVQDHVSGELTEDVLSCSMHLGSGEEDNFDLDNFKNKEEEKKESERMIFSEKRPSAPSSPENMDTEKHKSFVTDNQPSIRSYDYPEDHSESGELHGDRTGLLTSNESTLDKENNSGNHYSYKNDYSEGEKSHTGEGKYSISNKLSLDEQKKLNDNYSSIISYPNNKRSSHSGKKHSDRSNYGLASTDGEEKSELDSGDNSSSQELRANESNNSEDEINYDRSRTSKHEAKYNFDNREIYLSSEYYSENEDLNTNKMEMPRARGEFEFLRKSTETNTGRNHEDPYSGPKFYTPKLKDDNDDPGVFVYRELIFLDEDISRTFDEIDVTDNKVGVSHNKRYETPKAKYSRDNFTYFKRGNILSSPVALLSPRIKATYDFPVPTAVTYGDESMWMFFPVDKKNRKGSLDKRNLGRSVGAKTTVVNIPPNGSKILMAINLGFPRETKSYCMQMFKREMNYNKGRVFSILLDRDDRPHSIYTFSKKRLEIVYGNGPKEISLDKIAGYYTFNFTTKKFTQQNVKNFTKTTIGFRLM